jgi:APA family basic amino acid/polyamine antiporter
MIFRISQPNIERPFKCPAVFLVAPIALLASVGLLLKQIIGKNGEVLNTGKIFAYWLVIVLVLYLIKVFSKNKATSE